MRMNEHRPFPLAAGVDFAVGVDGTAFPRALLTGERPTGTATSPTDLPERDPDKIVDRPPKKHLPIDNDVVLPTPKPFDQPDVILPGDREGGYRDPSRPQPKPT
ncbi:hypothetical protein BN1110_04659 [bacterium YEK0313]|nr:hypothetical protein BN1110_04659 [bacterium YEK0313]